MLRVGPDSQSRTCAGTRPGTSPSHPSQSAKTTVLGCSSVSPPPSAHAIPSPSFVHPLTSAVAAVRGGHGHQHRPLPTGHGAGRLGAARAFFGVRARGLQSFSQWMTPPPRALCDTFLRVADSEWLFFVWPKLPGGHRKNNKVACRRRRWKGYYFPFPSHLQSSSLGS